MNYDANFENYFQEKDGDQAQRDGLPVDLEQKLCEVFEDFL